MEKKLQLLLDKYGIAKLNTMTKYPSIKTFHKRGDKGILTETITVTDNINNFTATEKIDGTNVRIIIYGDDYIVGSREFLLHKKGEYFYGRDLGIVDELKNLKVLEKLPKTDKFTIIYGELYGGKVTANSKNYGKSKYGFRIFDVVQQEDSDIKDILSKKIEDISSWREETYNNTLKYGQNFITIDEAKELIRDIEFVPNIDININDTSIKGIYNLLLEVIPETLVALTEDAKKVPEGIILRNNKRTQIAKVRLEDYKKYMKKNCKIN